VEVKGGRAFIEEEVVGRAPKEGGAAAHVLAALPLKFCGCHLCLLLSKVSRSLVDLASGKEEDEWRRVGGDVMYNR